MNEFSTSILGRRWRIVSADGLKDKYGVDGDCDAPNAKRKAIRYEPTLSTLDMLETLMHESHHAAFPSTDEDDVTQFAHDLRRIISRLFSVEKRLPLTKEVKSVN